MQRLSVMVVHGSYSEVYRQEFNLLLERVSAQVGHPVFGAYLECTELSMVAAIAQFLQPYLSNENIQLQILPLFLSPGVHVREDIPAAIAQLQTQFPAVNIQTLPYLGKAGRLTPFLKRQFAQHPDAQAILLAHGSRRSGANPKIETLANTLNANAAYWATAPSLQDTIAEMTRESLKVKTIHIVPYFLFSGRIPAAIASQVSELTETYPNVQIHLGQPFGTEPDCGGAIAELLNNEISVLNPQ